MITAPVLLPPITKRRPEISQLKPEKAFAPIPRVEVVHAMPRLLEMHMTEDEKSIPPKKEIKRSSPRTAKSASFITYSTRMEEEKYRHVNPLLRALSRKERQVSVL